MDPHTAFYTSFFFHRHTIIKVTLVTVIKEAGTFKTLISDHGQALTGKVMQAFCALFDIDKVRTSTHLPRSNSRAKRLHRSLGDHLRTFVTRTWSWSDCLPFIELARRSSPIAGLGLSSYEI